MAKSKQVSSKSKKFVSGGKGHMVGQQGVKPSAPGKITVSSPGKSSFGASGGKTKMFGKQSAMPAKCC